MDDDFLYQIEQAELERKKLDLEKNPVETLSVDNQQNTPSLSDCTAGSSATYTDPTDGTVYEWDFGKRAWFPKIDENFIAAYQANYGSHQLDLSQRSLPQPDLLEDGGAKTKLEEKVVEMTTEQRKELAKQRKKEKRKLAAERAKNATWFEMDEEHNTNVYVSSLPTTNFSEEQFEELMSKYGIIAKDALTRKPKIKLYRDADGNLKGDGRCCYIKKESVDLALDILNGSVVGDKTVSVELAKFELKGQFDPSKKRKKLSAKMKKQLKEQEERLLSWKPEKLRGERPRSDSTVVIKNAFDLQELTDNPVRLFDLQEELKQECSKYGTVRKLVVCDNNPEGVVTVTFAEPEEADDCVTMMNYRIFGARRQLRAETWDGRTKYKITEREQDAEKRLSQWEKFLETGDEAEQERQRQVAGLVADRPIGCDAQAGVEKTTGLEANRHEPIDRETKLDVPLEDV